MTKQGNLFPRGGDHIRVCINFCILLFLRLEPSFSLNLSRASNQPRQVPETPNTFATNVLRRLSRLP